MKKDRQDNNLYIIEREYLDRIAERVLISKIVQAHIKKESGAAINSR